MISFAAVLHHERTTRLREGHPWLTNVVLIALGCGLLGLSRQFLVESDHFVIGFSGVSGWSVFVYIAAAIVVLTQPVNRFTYYIVVSFAIAFQTMVYFDEPFTSSDIYRYVWDGIVQHAGINPYRYVPGDPALTFLRAPNLDVFNNINRRDYARTIYPPVAQMIYYFVTFFSPTVAGMKLAMIGFTGIAGATLVALLRWMGRSREEILLFAWCPLLIWEVGLAGHIDAVVVAFISLALLFRFKGKPLWTGLFLGLAILTKFYPVVLFPALYMRRDWKMPAVIAAMTVVSYSIYSSAGKYVLGFAAGYREEEGLNTGARYFLLQVAEKATGRPVSVNTYIVFCALVFAALIVWSWLLAANEVVVKSNSSVNTPKFIVSATAFAFAMMLLFSPHYPWYVVWLVPFIALVPNLPVMTYVLGLFYLLTTALADGSPEKTYILNGRLYALVAAAFVLQMVLMRWPVRKWFVAESHRPYC